jgi:formate-dependent nitrite reductase membrane component NrfD
MDDEDSKISRLIGSEQTMVRKPEAGTKPKLYYIEANPASLTPSEQTHSAGYLWSERASDPVFDYIQSLTEAEAKARTTYDVSHERPWGWKVSAYLWTKSISSGVFLMSALGLGLGFARFDWLLEDIAPVISMVFLAATLALLVFDLKRPERFLSILFRPQWKSWLVLGGYILAAFGAIVAAQIALRYFDLAPLETPLRWAGAMLAALSAVYSAFLFRQARGRVFWHSILTPFHLLAQAIAAGAAALMFYAALDSLVTGIEPAQSSFEFLRYELIGALVAHGVLMAGETLAPEENADKRRAALLITRGLFSKSFWGGAVGAGVALPLILLVAGAGTGAIIAAILALAGLLIWEHLWVQAGQAAPLS